MVVTDSPASFGEKYFDLDFLWPKTFFSFSLQLFWNLGGYEFLRISFFLWSLSKMWWFLYNTTGFPIIVLWSCFRALVPNENRSRNSRKHLTRVQKLLKRVQTCHTNVTYTLVFLSHSTRTLHSSISAQTCSDFKPQNCKTMEIHLCRKSYSKSW